MIKVVSGRLCAPCQEVKEMLDKNGIPYTDIPRDSEQGQRYLSQYGVGAVPLIIFKRGPVHRFFEGYSEKIKKNLISLFNNMPKHMREPS